MMDKDAEISRLAAELAETQRQLKMVAPVGRYNGRNIEEWAKHGQALEASLREISPAVRDVLWCALVWNDHNFQYSALREHAHAAMTALGLDRFNGVDAVNEWMARVDALLKPTLSSPAATSETDCAHPAGLVNGYCWICAEQVVPYSPAEPRGVENG